MKMKTEPELVEINSDDVRENANEIITWAEKKKLSPAILAGTLLFVLEALKEHYGFELKDITQNGVAH